MKIQDLARRHVEVDHSAASPGRSVNPSLATLQLHVDLKKTTASLPMLRLEDEVVEAAEVEAEVECQEVEVEAPAEAVVRQNRDDPARARGSEYEIPTACR